jgi:PAS domain-containing protein/anti-sigma regulatory factor (Ser/Thr protein kinase)
MMEDPRRAGETLRHASVDAVPALMSFFDADHICRFANDHHRHWYGRAPEALIGTHMRDFVGEQAYLDRRAYLDLVKSGETVAFESTVPHRDGSRHQASIRYVPRMGPQGFEGFFVLVVDLAPQLHRYHRIFEATVVAFWEIDLAEMHAAFAEAVGAQDPIAWLRAHPEFSRNALDSCKVLDLNSRAEHMFGITREKALATPFGHWCPPACEQHMLDNLIAYLSGKDGFEGETLMRRADGSLFPFTSAQPSLASPCPVRQALSPSWTSASASRARKRWRRPMRSWPMPRASPLWANSPPPSRMRSTSRWPPSSPTAMPRSAGFAAPSRIWGGRRGHRTHDRGRDARRPDHQPHPAVGDKSASERATIACGPMVAEAVAIVERQISGLGARLRIDLAEGLPPIHVDRIQLQQVIINLLVNAAQAMAGHGSALRIIDVRAWHEDGRVVIEVSDTGPGFSDEQASQLFNAFYTTKATGMGIGLSVSRTIIEAHEGPSRPTACPAAERGFASAWPSGRQSADSRPGLRRSYEGMHPGSARRIPFETCMSEKPQEIGDLFRG